MDSGQTGIQSDGKRLHLWTGSKYRLNDENIQGNVTALRLQSALNDRAREVFHEQTIPQNRSALRALGLMMQTLPQCGRDYV